MRNSQYSNFIFKCFYMDGKVRLRDFVGAASIPHSSFSAEISNSLGHVIVEIDSDGLLFLQPYSLAF